MIVPVERNVGYVFLRFGGLSEHVFSLAKGCFCTPLSEITLALLILFIHPERIHWAPTEC